MKETLKINLAQRLFDLDEDAYLKLKKYLDALNQYFNKQGQGAEEIMFDIEQRIAEILSGKLSGEKKAITLADVDEVIEMMGTLEDFTSEDSYAEEQPGKENSMEDYSREHRQLFRDSDHNLLGGVCSGLAAYFNMDPLWIRIIFIILFFINLIGLVIYLILWVIVPPAITRTQKLKMQGKPVNIENIEESVKSEFHKMKEGIQRFSETEGFKRTRASAEELFQGLGRILLVFFKIIGIIIGVVFALAGLALVFGLVAFFTVGNFWGDWQIPGFAFDQLMPAFTNLTIFSVALFFVIFIPVVAILASLIRLVFTLGKPNKYLSAFAWTFWSLVLVFVIITLITGKNNEAFSHHYKDTMQIDIQENSTLHLRLNEEDLSGRKEYYTVFGKEIINDRWDDSFLLRPEIEILPAENSAVSLLVEYTSFIPFEYDELHREMTYHYRFQDSLLVMDNYWRVSRDELWRLPDVRVKIFVPERQHIRLDPDLRKNAVLLSDGEKWPEGYFGNDLVMVKGRLVRP